MERQVRLTVLYLTLLSNQGKIPAPAYDWPGIVTQTISRLPGVRDKIDRLVEFQPNESWEKRMRDDGPGWGTAASITGSLSIYSSDVDSVKELMSAILEESEVQDIPQLWTVGYEEVKINQTSRDLSELAEFAASVTKNPNLTTSEFHECWRQFVPTFYRWPLVPEKVMFYVQFHSSPEWTQEFAEMGLKMSTFDGMANIYFDHMEDMFLVFNADYAREMFPKEAAFTGKNGALKIGADRVVEIEGYSSS